MKTFNKTIISFLLIISLLLSAVSCADLGITPGGGGQGGSETETPEFYINGETQYILAPGDVVTLTLTIPEGTEGEVKWESSHSCVEVEGGVVTVLSYGTSVVKATLGDYTDRVIILVPGVGSDDSDDDGNDGGNDDVIDDGAGDTDGDNGTGDEDDNGGNNGNGGSEGGDNDDDSENGNGGSDDSGDTDDGGGDTKEEFGAGYETITVAEALALAEQYTSASSTEKFYVIGTIDEITSASDGRMYIYDETGLIYVYKSKMSSELSLSITSLHEGDVVLLYGTLRNYRGTLEIDLATVIAIEGYYAPPIENDPYYNVDVDEFYASYKPATSYEDAYYRTLHNLMSGSIAAQDQAPTISTYRPMSNGLYIRNTSMIYSEDGNTYYVMNAYGEIVMEIYKGAAYIMLEEVAAHVFAFGEPPANQTSSKNASPASSAWGEYLRLNHSSFSGDTDAYPYEPKLPNISGCGGTLNYYEMDIGTTGTDCDPSYPSEIYNDGKTITRGAARIVYVAEDDDGNGVIDHDERYVFYTYNHYNDFQEYLNYLGGWGEMFGNITGGGRISSKTDYNPTPYVKVTLGELSANLAVDTVLAVLVVDIRKYLLTA